ncbi:hypothetical protein EYF80_024324 [Liparis tanakae]|uniref:Uncharacterized protein n=1 Tax=Liparis tanakae TaxID=230148 RepID=A0A4Z2HJR0_9TELE|nr:hypothetical protein EYF80_024324 [Liparis tanakae]
MLERAVEAHGVGARGPRRQRVTGVGLRADGSRGAGVGHSADGFLRASRNWRFSSACPCRIASLLSSPPLSTESSYEGGLGC